MHIAPSKIGRPFAGLLVLGLAALATAGPVPQRAAAANGAHGDGMAFELTPNSTKTAWTEQALYSFCAEAGCTDGASSYSGLVMDQEGNLYGMACNGGARGAGVAFELKPNRKKTAWSETVLHSFCAAVGCTDGVRPYFVPILDSSGDLYSVPISGERTTPGSSLN